MTFTDHLLNFFSYGTAMLVFMSLIYGLVSAQTAYARRREERAERDTREEAPRPYPKKTSASA